jgi:hypothetical protein
LETGPDIADPLVQVGEGARVVDHDVGDGQPLFPGGLGRHPGPRVLGGHAAVPGQPLDLQLRRHVHDDNKVKPGIPGPSALGKQRDVMHDHRRAAGGRLFFRSGHVLVYQGMNDRVQPTARFLIGEDHLAELRPVKRAVGQQDTCTERGRHPR